MTGKSTKSSNKKIKVEKGDIVKFGIRRCVVRSIANDGTYHLEDCYSKKRDYLDINPNDVKFIKKGEPQSPKYTYDRDSDGVYLDRFLKSNGYFAVGRAASRVLKFDELFVLSHLINKERNMTSQQALERTGGEFWVSREELTDLSPLLTENVQKATLKSLSSKGFISVRSQRQNRNDEYSCIRWVKIHYNVLDKIDKMPSVKPKTVRKKDNHEFEFGNYDEYDVG